MIGQTLCGRMLAVGPITTTAEIQVEVQNPKELCVNLGACTCALCRTSHIQSSTIPDLRQAESV